VEAAMADDLNTPAALAALQTMAEETLTAAAEGRDVTSAAAAIRDLAGMIGFTLSA
jgi:cysteinyl-tRNA synthetase